MISLILGIHNHIMKHAGVYVRGSLMAVILLLPLGIYMVIVSPSDYQQGDWVRFMYIHVPAAWLALGIYLVMGILALIFLTTKQPQFFLLINAMAPVGAVYAFLTLVTGSIWGRYSWGSWWVWDARLTSMLILFMFYLAYLMVTDKNSHNLVKAQISAIIALFGLINVPLVKFSVDIWHSLHQSSSIFSKKGVAIHSSMLKPLLLMFAINLLASFAIIVRRNVLLIEKRKIFNSKLKQEKGPL